MPTLPMTLHVCVSAFQHRIMTHILPNQFVFGLLGENIQRSEQQDLTTRTGTEKTCIFPKASPNLSDPLLKERGFDAILSPYISNLCKLTHIQQTYVQ